MRRFVRLNHIRLSFSRIVTIFAGVSRLNLSLKLAFDFYLVNVAALSSLLVTQKERCNRNKFRSA